MENLNPGDLVKVLHLDGYSNTDMMSKYVGQTGSVTDYSYGDTCFSVEFSDGATWFWERKSLMKIDTEQEKPRLTETFKVGDKARVLNIDGCSSPVGRVSRFVGHVGTVLKVFNLDHTDGKGNSYYKEDHVFLDFSSLTGFSGDVWGWNASSLEKVEDEKNIEEKLNPHGFHIPVANPSRFNIGDVVSVISKKVSDEVYKPYFFEEDGSPRSGTVERIDSEEDGEVYVYIKVAHDLCLPYPQSMLKKVNEAKKTGFSAPCLYISADQPETVTPDTRYALRPDGTKQRLSDDESLMDSILQVDGVKRCYAAPAAVTMAKQPVEQAWNCVCPKCGSKAYQGLCTIVCSKCG